jgi:hypothetical protein
MKCVGGAGMNLCPYRIAGKNLADLSAVHAQMDVTG